jgi:hypothetical protein
MSTKPIVLVNPEGLTFTFWITRIQRFSRGYPIEGEYDYEVYCKELDQREQFGTHSEQSALRQFIESNFPVRSQMPIDPNPIRIAPAPMPPRDIVFPAFDSDGNMYDPDSGDMYDID